MSNDQFTKTETTGYGSRLGNSIGAVGTGFVLFFTSFTLLYWNEGRINLGNVAAKAIQIESTTAMAEDANGKLVSVNGKLESNATVKDEFVSSNKFLSLGRHVEIYAWDEESETKTTKNLGGSETKKTTYTYTKEWTSFPSSSNNFERPEGHYNPEMIYKSTDINVADAKIGSYKIADAANLQMPNDDEFKIQQSDIHREDVRLEANKIYMGSRNPNNPQVGDYRISYHCTPNPLAAATVFGKLNGADIGNYETEDVVLYRAFKGDHSTAVATLKKEHKIITWMLRLGGFLMMWIGLSAILGPISTFLDILPFLGSLSRGLIGLVTFLVALVLSFITIVVSVILHSWILMAIVLLLVVGGVVLRNKKKARA